MAGEKEDLIVLRQCRRFRRWVRGVMLSQLVQKNNVVCELFCAESELSDWVECGVSSCLAVDPSMAAVASARQVVQDKNLVGFDFAALDPCKDRIQRENGKKFHSIACFDGIQRAFASEEMLRVLLTNVAENLEKGGYFFGTSIDSSVLWTKAQKTGPAQRRGAIFRIATENYVVEIGSRTGEGSDGISEPGLDFQQFGTPYSLSIPRKGVQDSGFLVHFPSLSRMARELHLRMLDLSNFVDFYESYRKHYAEKMLELNVLDTRGRISQTHMDYNGADNSQLVYRMA